MKRQDESGETWDGKGWDQNISSLGSIGVSGREYVDETAAQGDQVWHCSDSGEGGGEFDKDDEGNVNGLDMCADTIADVQEVDDFFSFWSTKAFQFLR